MHYLKQPKPTPEEVTAEIRSTVSTIISDVSREGTAAVRRYSERFDDWAPASFRVSAGDIERAYETMDGAVAESSRFLIDQVTGFARLQRRTLIDFEQETLPGVILGQKWIPVDSVGAYSPGGYYPLIASAVMTVATAKVAEVPRVLAAAPPRDELGMHRPQLWAMVESGADEIFCVGGVQAMAGMAFGLEDAEPVDMIVGPGNAYVAEAKRQLFGTVGIDLLAGPTEIMIIADDSADPVVLACDLLGQAEHGPTSPAILATTSEEVGRATIREVDRWLEGWPTASIAGRSWADFGTVILVDDDEELRAVADEIAPEHLEVQTRDPEWFVERLTNYGSLFIGTHATVSYSDKAIGTNHTLPTKRAARYTGGLWVGKFLKTVTTQRCTAAGSLAVAEHSAVVADAELMEGHAISARLRLNPEFFPDVLDHLDD
ncbi:MAG: histidinol dehydrogenase [Acidimicrobiia bacterium]|nr:histidinol dehydrogenase [Acidimicrobiia bacterium]MDH4308800.1 histidinol dehydrogenase [Acidimicrobiia bacterium]